MKLTEQFIKEQIEQLIMEQQSPTFPVRSSVAQEVQAQ